MESKFTGKNVAVLGLGMEGKDVVNYLAKLGAKVTILDRKEKKDLNLTGIDTSELKFVCGSDYLVKGLSMFDIIVRSPGVYRYIPEIVEAERQGSKITSDIKLFFENCPAKIIGVTGTKGKGTTSTLVYEILKDSGYNVYLAGNIGKPCLELLPKLSEKSWVVMELSSFQLIDLTISPHIAVFLNIFPEHLDYYEDFLDYFKSKLKIIKFQTEKDYFVFNEDINIIRDIVLKSKAQKYGFTANPKRSFTTLLHSSVVNKTIDAEAVLEGMKVKYSEKGLLKHTYDMKDLKLRGKHNLLNSMVAIIVSEICGCNYSVIKKCLGTFTAVEGRIETVGIIKGVEYVNDTLATIPEATIAAIDSFPKEKKITLILGGFDRGLDFDILGEDICKRKNIDNIILIGQTADKIERSLLKNGFVNHVYKLGKTTMLDIVKLASKLTSPNGLVLMSPASTSFDMFKDYKDRGDKFRQTVLELK